MRQIRSISMASFAFAPTPRSEAVSSD